MTDKILTGVLIIVIVLAAYICWTLGPASITTGQTDNTTNTVNLLPG